MEAIKETQRVVLFSDDKITGEQSCLIQNDPDGLWINVLHCGDEFSMSLQNWNKLVELVELAKSKITK